MQKLDCVVCQNCKSTAYLRAVSGDNPYIKSGWITDEHGSYCPECSHTSHWVENYNKAVTAFVDHQGIIHDYFVSKSPVKWAFRLLDGRSKYTTILVVDFPEKSDPRYKLYALKQGEHVVIATGLLHELTMSGVRVELTYVTPEQAIKHVLKEAGEDWL